MYAGIGCTGAAKDFPAACLIPPARILTQNLYLLHDFFEKKKANCFSPGPFGGERMREKCKLWVAKLKQQHEAGKHSDPGAPQQWC